MFSDPSLTCKGEPGGKSERFLDSSHMPSYYLLIHFKDLKGDKDNSTKYLTPIRGTGGKSDCLSRLPAYSFLLPPNIFKTSKSKNKREAGGGEGRDKSEQIFRLSAHGFLLPPNTFYDSKYNT